MKAIINHLKTSDQSFRYVVVSLGIAWLGERCAPEASPDIRSIDGVTYPFRVQCYVAERLELVQIIRFRSH